MIKENSPIVKAWVIKATLKTVSPLIVGAGEGEFADKILQRNSDGKPTINGSSFFGALRTQIRENYIFKYEDDLSEQYLLGTEGSGMKKNTRSSQSHIKVLPIEIISSPEVVILDGIKINGASNIAEDKAKYDYEVINNEICFNVGFEIYVREGMNKNDFMYYALALNNVLAMSKEQDFTIGAFASLGYGKLELVKNKLSFFSFPEDATTWFKYKADGTLVNPFDVKNITTKPIPKAKNDFSIVANFSLKTSLITGFMKKGAQSDKSHYHFNDSPSILGKAIKGAINHRLIRILRTLSIHCPDEMIKELVGYGADDKNKNGKINRLKVDFVNINRAKSMLQDRVKIDRFTQGTITGAKFDSEPIWPETENMLTISLKIKDYEAWEAGLILLVLKDLWLADLPIGGEKNVGRGVLTGKKAVINFKIRETDSSGKKVKNKKEINIDENGMATGDGLEYTKIFMASLQKLKS